MGRRKKAESARQNGSQVKVSFVLPWDLYQRLEVVCRRRRSTSSALLRRLLQNHLEDPDRPRPVAREGGWFMD